MAAKPGQADLIAVRLSIRKHLLDEIPDSAAFGDGLIMMKSGGGARQTDIGGAELGATQQGGGTRGEVNLG